MSGRSGLELGPEKLLYTAQVIDFTPGNLVVVQVNSALDGATAA